MRERDVESYLRKRVREAGGSCHKLVAAETGMPDRLVLAPGGLVYLVETKAPDGRHRPGQIVWHAKAAQRGVTVHTLYTKEEVDSWVAAHIADVQ